MDSFYTTEELQKIQALELEALNVIIDICTKCNIEYFLIGGTALGAIRHDGFIPWDDDIDIGMTRENYQQFIQKAPQLLSEKYYLQTPYSDNKNPYFYSKLRINGTKFIEYCNHRINMNHGVYVDIFPFDEVPDDEELNKKQFDKVQRLVRLFSLRQSPDVSMEPTTVVEKIKGHVRKILYFIMQMLPYKSLCNRLEKEIVKYNGTEQQAIACLNFPKRKTEYILKKDLYPLKRHRFESVSAYIPQNYDVYLKTHYGDYMKLPPKEQQFGHKPYCVELNN